jgi:hypothetical protein
LYLQVFAASTLYRLFGMSGSDAETMMKRTHPPASIRRSILGIQFEVWFKRWMPTKIESFKVMPDIISRAELDTDLAFKEISEKEDVMQESLDSLKFSLDNADFITRMMPHWNKLRPLLQPHAFTEVGYPWAWHGLVFKDSV